MAHISFGADGWRARVGDGFDEETLARAASAAGSYWSDTFPSASVYIGYDTRAGAREAAELAASIVASYGLHTVLASAPIPAPVLSWTIAKNAMACGGLMISAGRSPASYLGVKLRDRDGAPDTGTLSRRIAKRLTYPATTGRAAFETADLIAPYADDIVSKVNTQLIAEAKPRIVIDALYGAFQNTAAEILTRCGAEVIELHPEPDATFGGLVPDLSHGSSAFAALAVRQRQAAAGFVFDGDGDGLVGVLPSGELATTNILIPILAHYLVNERGMEGGIVTSSAGSALLRRMAKQLGLPYTVVPTGYQWIYNEMNRGPVLIAGNESGAIAVPSHLKERDPLYAIALITEAMAASRGTLQTLAEQVEAEIGRMIFGRVDVALDSVAIDMLSNVLPGVNPGEVIGRKPKNIDHADGLRVTFADDSWVLVRPSGHDLLMRVYAEAPSIVERDALLEWGQSLTSTYI